jgi:hypothetical protein
MRLPRPSRPSLLLLAPLLVGLITGLAGVSPASASSPAWSSADSHGHTSFFQIAGTVLSGVGEGHRAHSTLAAAHALENAQHLLGDKKPDFVKDLKDKADDATMALTNLFTHRDDLSTSDQKVAARVLARPSGSSRMCNDAQKVCVHYSTSGSNKSTKAWATKVLGVVSHVAKTYASSGYRRPVGDGTKGSHKNYVDIYLADVAPQGYYGYCAPESGKYVATAYCVLDNDYAASQYGTRHTPTENLEVTAAHEYFHAVQFAYDVNEDTWFMEATATWAEDQIYTRINDNRQYLPYGQLRKPRVPLDKDTTFGVYGNWIFFRYISEHLPAKKGALPSIMLQIWKKAAVSADRKHNKYSVAAITSALAARKTSIKKIYAGFATANLHPKLSYKEGASTRYPVAKAAGSTTLKPAKKKASGYFNVQHLASATRRFKPHNLGTAWQLRLSAHLPKHRLGVAIVTVYKMHRTNTRYIKLNAKGNGHVRVDFDNAHVKKVELTLVNTAHGYKCHQGTAYACKGKPTTDTLKDTWSAKLVKS